MLKSKDNSFTTCAPLHHLGQKADLRRPITAWRALVWAYRDECVRAANAVVEQAALVHEGPAAIAYESDRVRGGLINGLLIAHADAHAIDATVAAWFDDEPGWALTVGLSAEKGELPPRAEDLKPLRFLPLHKVNGEVMVSGRRPGAEMSGYCPLAAEGYTEAQIARHQVFDALFAGLLGVLPGLKLEKWQIVA